MAISSWPPPRVVKDGETSQGDPSAGRPDPLTGPLSRHGSVAMTVFGATVVVLGPTAIAVASDPTSADWRWLYVFLLCVSAVLFQAGLALGLRYHAFGEAQIGWLAAGLVAASIPHGAVALSALITGRVVPAATVGASARAALAVPLCVICLLFLRSRARDRRLRPLTWGMGVGALAAVAATSSSLVLGNRTLPAWMMLASDVALMLALLVLAVLIARTRVLSSRARSYAITVVCLFAVTLGVVTTARLTGTEQLLAAAVVTLLAATAVIVVSTVTLLWDAYELDMARLKRWLDKADAAERGQRRTQERLHQVRSSVAALRGGLGVLTQQRDLAMMERARIEQLLDQEASRLHRLVAVADLAAVERPRVVSLDDIIRPVAIAERAQGTHVGWVPAGVLAECDPWATAEILRILLANVRSHAPGACVWVTTAEAGDICQLLVTDNGPGVDPAVRDALFRRGVRSSSSQGEGIGLVLARRLAREQGGDLGLVPRPPGTGAVFVVHLPRPNASVVDQRSKDDRSRSA